MENDTAGEGKSTAYGGCVCVVARGVEYGGRRQMGVLKIDRHWRVIRYGRGGIRRDGGTAGREGDTSGEGGGSNGGERLW